MALAFASTADTQDQKAELVEFAEGVYGYISTFDPNAGAIVGPKGILAVDTRATPALAREFIRDLENVARQPVRHIFLTHYHGVRVLGASAYQGASVVASVHNKEVIELYGALDKEVEYRRFPRLFKGGEEVAGLTKPDITFRDEIEFDLGRPVVLRHAGRGHTGADGIVWLPFDRILFSGDLVEHNTTPYCGEAWFDEWIKRLDELAELHPHILMPGRGPAVTTLDGCLETIRDTRGFLTDLLGSVRASVDQGRSLEDAFKRTMDDLISRYGKWAIFEHAMPFNVARAYDYLRGVRRPIPWTAVRDQVLWKELHGS